MERSKINGKLAEEIEIIRKIGQTLVWIEGQLLYSLKTKGDYKKMKLTWKEVIQKLSIPKSTAEMRIRVYQFWVVEKKISIEVLSQINVRKLDRAISFIKSGKVRIVDVLEESRRMSIKEFLNWLNL